MEELFSIEETTMLNKTQTTRNKLLDGYLDKGIDKLDAEDLDVVTKLLDSIDKQIHTNKRLKLSKKTTEDNSNVLELVKRVLLQPLPIRTQGVELQGLKEISVNPEELKNDREIFTVDDFLRTEDD